MKGASIAVGVFDGVHLGHQEILARAVRRARERGGEAVVLSFDPHPDLVLAKSFQALAPLTPIQEKRDRLRAMGVQRFELLPFTRELAAFTPEEFADRHLVTPYHLHTLVVGEDFALGRGRSGDVTRLRAIGRERGFELEAIPLLERDGAPVTSSRIRAQLVQGQVAAAARLLGYPYALSGTVVAGDAVGRALGFPTANLRLHEEKLVPAHGIYAVWAAIGGERRPQPAAMSIGVRPTFGGQVRTLEVHLLDWSGDLLGRELEVRFVDWLRSEERFGSREALIAAMAADVAETRRRLALAPAPETR